MYYRTSGEVQHAPFVEKSIRMPGPVSQRAINEYTKENNKNKIGVEFDALSKATRDKGRSDDGKFHLKYGKEHKRNSRSEGRICVEVYISEEGKIKWIADQAMKTAAKAKTETYCYP